MFVRRSTKGLIAAVAATMMAHSNPALAQSQTCSATQTVFNATGGLQSFTVPAGVTSVTIDAVGAQGGSGMGTRFGAFGAEVAATVSVTPGSTLCVLVPSRGSNGNSTG